ncbi:iron ABC transporter permease [Vibrio sp. AK197]
MAAMHAQLFIRYGVLVLSVLICVGAFVTSLALGQYSVSLQDVWLAFWHPDPSAIEHVIVTTIRLSRSVVAVSVGAALAVAGVLMQTLTRNPLASPAIFGVNAGAVFFIVLASQWFAMSAMSDLVWIAFLGAAVAGALVYTLGNMGRDAQSPVRMVLAGAAVTALFMAFTQGLLVVGQEGVDSVLFWVAGSVSGRELDVITPVLPYLLGVMLAALFLAPHMNILLSGDDVATGLGVNTTLLKAALSVLVIILAGASISMAGNIGFIGLVVPHMARAVVGNDHKWLLLLSAIWGASLLLIADVAGRLMIAPQEVPIGVMTALIGTPFFIYLARKGKRDA